MIGDLLLCWYALGWVAVGLEWKLGKYGILTPFIDFLLPPFAIVFIVMESMDSLAIWRKP